MSRAPWLKLRKKTDPEPPLEPPIRLGNFSNGELFHEQIPLERKIRREILRQADEKSRRLGIDRREFLGSALGMATSLSVLNMAACSGSGSSGSNGGSGGNGIVGPGGSGGFSGGASTGGGGAFAGSGGLGPGSGGAGPGSGGFSGGAAGGAGPGSGGTPSDGGYSIPPDATRYCELAEDILSVNEFIFVIQSHHLEQEGSWRTTNPGAGSTVAGFFALYNGCTSLDPIDCVDAQAYLEKIFLESDTTVAVLSGFPTPLCTDGRTTNCGNPIDNDAMVASRDRMNAIARSQRVVNHCQVNPTDRLDLQLAIMERIAGEHGVWGWKCYPEWGPNGAGWFLDDPASGIPMIEKARELGVKVICIHKGIVFPGWDAAASHPRDVGVVAKAYPDTKFVVYHSAIELGAGGEGPYNPNNTLGTDRLVRTVVDNDLTGKNVYAELGSVWFQIMNNPTVAQHVIGKLLRYVGPDNVLWGSECVWYGSPQPQIEAFRAFQISQQFQDQYGYPALTPEIKAKIFGLSSAAVYGVDPNEIRCRVKQTALSELKGVMDGELGSRRWAEQRMGGPRSWREFWNLARVTGGRPG
jgi:predicted TIM-barrel fold metal-dependent hydrolase